MGRPLRAFGLVLLVGSGLLVSSRGGTAAQAGPTVSQNEADEKGVVWTPPTSDRAARHALRRMHAMGATAVRLTRPLDGERVLATADTLGLALYVDLPVAYLSARALADTAAFARRALDRVLAQSRRHSSLRAVGLARGADTTTPSACAYLDTLARQVRAESDLRTYYVTPFPPSADRCVPSVDAVLVDLVEATDPQGAFQRWTEAAAAVGVGAVGHGVRPQAASGLRVPHSPERQARRLEQGLPRLLDDASGAPVFVYRWQDRSAERTTRRYGLHSAGATPRPAARVVAGLFTGRQTTFALPRGTAPATGAPWLVLVGWGLLAGLGMLSTQYAQMRRTLPRYVLSHGFYRDDIRRGRDLMPEVNVVLLVGAVCALGIGALVAARALAADPSVRHVLAALPDELRQVAARWIETPVTYGVEVGVGAGLLLCGWGAALSAAARPWGGLSTSQVLMLLAWPHWPAWVGLVAALVLAAPGPGAYGGWAAAGLAAGGFGLAVWIVVRVLRDYAAVASVPAPVAALLALASPPAVVVFGSLGIVAYYDLPVRYLYHLLTLT